MCESEFTNSLAVIDNNARSIGLMPALSMAQMIARREVISDLIREKVLVDGADYGLIPGTGPKKVLLKPGAERLCSLFGLAQMWEVVKSEEDWDGDSHKGEPFFYYWYRCHLTYGGTIVASADGSCNSHEKKFRYHWVLESDVPRGMDKSMYLSRESRIKEPLFAIQRGITDGKWGKPAEYWEAFRVAIDARTALHTFETSNKSNKEIEYYAISTKMYRVPNEEMASDVNTLQKMGQKRALIAATLIATNASEFFTQDLEDRVSEADYTYASEDAGPQEPSESRAPIGKSVDSVVSEDPRKLRIAEVSAMIRALPKETKTAWAAWMDVMYQATKPGELKNTELDGLYAVMCARDMGAEGPPSEEPSHTEPG